MSIAPFDLVNVIVRAGAGAGKTTELTERVIKLAQNFKKENQNYPHFVVTTFTRKATQELKERLMKVALKENDPALLEFVKSPSRLHISTIHGVLSLFLAQYASVLGLSPKIKIVSDSTEQTSLKKKLRDLCRIDQEFNESFQSLLETFEFQELMAGFSSFVKIKMQYGNISRALPLDFAQIAKQESQSLITEMKDLANQILSDSNSLPSANGRKENKGLQAWIDYANYLKIPSNLKEMPQDWQKFWIQFDEGIPSTRKGKDTPESWLQSRESIQKKTESLCSPKVSIEFWNEHEQAAKRFEDCANKISTIIVDEKLTSGEITMSDLENLSLELIRRNSETAKSFSKTWNYWLVDEYQDTSPVQVELLEALIGDRKSFVVGDPQQSIYLFRGAKAEVFSNKEKKFSTTDGLLAKKMKNYRSTPSLLECINFLFTRMSDQFQAMETRDQVTGSDKVLDIMVCPEDKDSETHPEITATLFRIQELLAQGIAPEKICVLAKSNDDLEQLGLAAKLCQVPVQVHSSGSFFERPEVIDGLALLKFLCNPHDNFNFLQLLRGPYFHLSDTLIADLVSGAKDSYWLSFLETKKDSSILNLLSFELVKTRKIGIGQVWVNLLIQRGYFQFAQLLDPSGRREANIWKLIHLVKGEEKKPGFNYLQFLNDLQTSVDTEETQQADAVPVVEPKRVHLMTVHASKGLQFEHVLLPRMGKTPPPPKSQFFMFNENSLRWTLSLVNSEDGKKVSSLVGQQILETLKSRQSEEDERVFYVAATRAEKSLTFIFSDNFKPESWAGKIPFSLTAGEHQEPNFSYLVRSDRFQVSSGVNVVQSMNALSAKYHWISGGNQLTSVTEMIAGPKEAQENQEVAQQNVAATESRKLQISDIQKALTGVQVHRIFETLKYSLMRDPAFDWKNLRVEDGIGFDEALKYLMTDQNGIWGQVIRNGEVEFGFSALSEQKINQKVIQGQIDLWGRDDHGQAWVVDYKTGSPKYSEKAFQQLEVYAWALAKMKKLDPNEKIQLAVIYPFAQKTLVRPSQLKTGGGFPSFPQT